MTPNLVEIYIRNLINGTRETLPANYETVHSILALNLVLSWGAQWVDKYAPFVPKIILTTSHQRSFFHSILKTTNIIVNEAKNDRASGLKVNVS